MKSRYANIEEKYQKNLKMLKIFAIHCDLIPCHATRIGIIASFTMNMYEHPTISGLYVGCSRSGFMVRMKSKVLYKNKTFKEFKDIYTKYLRLAYG